MLSFCGHRRRPPTPYWYLYFVLGGVLGSVGGEMTGKAVATTVRNSSITHDT